MQAKEYAQALYEAIHEVRPEDQEKVIENMARVLQENGDLGLYDQIEAEYQRLEKEAKGIKTVEVTTAQDINSKDLIKELNQVIGDKAEIKQKIDQGLVGGVVVKVDDLLIDASVKNSLNKLRGIIAKGKE